MRSPSLICRHRVCAAKRKLLTDDVQKKIVQQYPVSFLFSVLLQQYVDPRVKDWFYSIDGYNVRVEDAWLND